MQEHVGFEVGGFQQSLSAPPYKLKPWQKFGQAVVSISETCQGHFENPSEHT